MNTLQQEEERKVEQGKDGVTNSNEDGTSHQLAHTPLPQTLNAQIKHRTVCSLLPPAMCPVPKKHGYRKRPVMVKGVAQSEALPPGNTGNGTR